MKPEAASNHNSAEAGRSPTLYEVYSAFARELFAKDETKQAPMKQEEFEVWWRGLPGHARQKYEQDYRKGWLETLAEGKKKIMDVLIQRREVTRTTRKVSTKI